MYLQLEERKWLQSDMQKKGITIFLIVLFLTGLVILLYPSISNWLHVTEQLETIDKYLKAVGEMTEDDYDIIWSDAEDYNKHLANQANRYSLSAEEHARYMSLLNISGNGVMGYLEIPKINLKIPIYHGTEETVLQVAIGHIAGSSLPVGGESTHCVLSGHRGLPSAKLFTDLDRLQVGDAFLLNVLHKTLTYEVDQILVVEPEDVSELEIVAGKDYCTLMTCTPYGINTHRLLVRGHRI